LTCGRRQKNANRGRPTLVEFARPEPHQESKSQRLVPDANFTMNARNRTGAAAR
jgi:hypothetical protein